MQDNAPSLLEQLDHGPGGVAGCFNDFDALGDDDAGVAFVVWGDERGE